MTRDSIYRWVHRNALLVRILQFVAVVIAVELAKEIGVFVRGYPSIGGEICIPIGIGLIWWTVQTVKQDKVRDRKASRNG